MIFEYALTDGISQSLEGFFSRHTDRFGSKFEDMCRNNIAVNLLRTCRAVYLETWALPLSLNSYILFDINTQSKSNIELHELFPWQLGLIQSLDITLQQCSLEGKGSRLYQYLHRGSTWQVEARHKGAYVAPRRYKSNKKPRAMVEFPASFNFTLVPAETNQPRPVLSQILGLYPRQVTLTRSPPPWSSKMRVTLAKPLAHLTLRLEHHDWWTWGDHPDSTNPLQQLGLDPTMGDGYADESLRPTKLRMIGLADERRAGQHPHAFPDQGWAATIADLPDLKSLRLVLETFALKAKQLDVVVEAAKTWRFPIARSDCELVWDGEVEAKRSVDMKSLDGRERVAEDINPEDPWDWGTHEFEVRVVRFVRRRVL
ncbi:hypothetical protein GQ44DRAFT_710755 [Phaeosphaeriaceae sp. PMI808]|nr:hypothetical protein GQ44DRAFT_710755 [Phaeosphaeriaceae sp. PMI808]